MEEPLVRTGSNDNSDIALVSEEPVKKALAALEAGEASEAIRILMSTAVEKRGFPAVSWFWFSFRRKPGMWFSPPGASLVDLVFSAIWFSPPSEP